jgi:hypothetical protein
MQVQEVEKKLASMKLESICCIPALSNSIWMITGHCQIEDNEVPITQIVILHTPVISI